MQLKALDQWTRDVPLQGERGGIFDATGKRIAACETVYTVYVRPNAVEDKNLMAKTLSAVFGIDENYLKNKLYSGVSEVTVKKKVEKSSIDVLRQTGLKGIYYAQNIKRVYPYGDFLSSVIGFTNVDGVGQSGLESYYNSFLMGKDGKIYTEADLVGREKEDAITFYEEGKKGSDVYLTVDYGIQNFIQNAVNEAKIEHNAKSASCIMMNAKTGRIVGLARSPSFDLNDLPRDNMETLMYLSKNTLVCDVYEPGSTFKILTASIGLEEKLFTTETHVYCPGYRIVDGQKIKCWKTIGHGSQDFVKGVQNSCNCLFMDIALKVGVEKLYDGLERFGVMEKTGVDISGEGKGISIAREKVKKVDLARIGFGQAVAVTPIALLSACASVINGGKLMRPYIVEKVVDTSGKDVYRAEPTVRRFTISEGTSEKMREILESVVTEGGGKNAQVAGYRIGGKTGTAQKYENGGIARGKYVSTFVGFAPANDPEYILLFIVDEPTGGVYYGSMVAAPKAAEIFSNTFNYLGWKGENVIEKESFLMPDLVGRSVDECDKILKEKKLVYQYLEKEGVKVTYQIPAPGSKITEDTVVYIEG